ncbi:phosphohydrolase [Acetobacter indonesiensis]|uniref:phosphohydrolase n=1 Tax=Acetobacter indonesiensis TaxID=104101 RepID=UPI000A3D18EA|nr:phosphohydrolase [Acetobacter indonesiensis]OUI95592.1 phosphohydrolase [Acetobacter indonesiensis]
MIARFSGPWPILPLSPTCRVVVRDSLSRPSAERESEINRLWADAQQKSPTLFNGCVFSADKVTATEIQGHWTEYRLVLAQMKKPTLFPILKLQPLAVIGLVKTPDGYILGRRHPSSLYQGNFWQSPPAGSIERRHDGSTQVDLAEQILAEAEEELGLPAHSLTVGNPSLIARHPGTRILDIGIQLETSLSFAEVKAKWQESGNTEYDQLALVTKAERESWLNRDDLLPTSRALLQAV